MGFNRSVVLLALYAGAAAAGLLGAAMPASAQPAPGAGAGRSGAEQLQREARLRELQQIELDTRLRANQAIPPGQRVLIDYGAYIQLNYLDLDDQINDNHILRQYELIPYLRLNFDGAHEVFLRGRIGYRDFNDGDSFDGRGDEPIDGDLDRGYYRFNLGRSNAAYGTNIFGARPGGFNVAVQGGRDFIYWGNGLVLAQTLDGGILDLELYPFQAQLIAGVTPTRTVDIDTSRPGFDYNTKRSFIGALVSMDAGGHRPYVYGLSQQDQNRNEYDLLALGPIETHYHYDSWYVGVGSVGALTDRLRYGVEAAYQGGDTFSNSFELSPSGGLLPLPQTRNSISAAAFDVRLDYLFNDPAQTRLSGELIGATGDSDRGHTSNTFNGNRRNTKDQAFNAFGLLNTGLAFAPDVSNILAGRVGLSTFPLPNQPIFQRMQVGADFFVFGRFEDDAPIDEPVADDRRYLGLEPDLYLNWQITSDVTLALRYGVFFPNGNAFQESDPRHFFFAGLTFAF